EAVLDQAVRDGLGSWYAAAIEASGVVPVGDPELDLAKLPDAGEDLSFTIEVGVLPTAEISDYEGLQVPRRDPHVDERALEAELDALRERFAKLETAERAAADGDYVVIDYVGSLRTTDAGADAGAEDADGGGEAEGEGTGAGEERLEPFAGGEGRDQL